MDEVDREVNQRIARYRITVEHTFGMLKKFACLKQVWRHSLEEQNIVFQVCAQITNIKMKMGMDE